MALDDDIPADGLRLLRRHHEATIQHHERRSDVRFVLEGSTGALVFPCEPGFAAASELVIHLPDEVTCHLQLAGEPGPIDRPEAEEAVDRWHAYHAATSGSGGSWGGWGGGGSEPGRRWVRCEVLGAKRPNAPGQVYAAEALAQPNALRKSEPGLVRLANAFRDRLGPLCRRRAGVDVADPLCVGVDPFGLDIRARFGIVRVEFDLEAATPDQARSLIEAMLSKVA